jgi:hypothetical protein
MNKNYMCISFRRGKTPPVCACRKQHCIFSKKPQQYEELKKLMILFSTFIKYKDRLLKTENRIIRMTQNSYYTSEVLGQLQVH